MNIEGLKYCLGYTHKKCDTCRNEKNWQMLNQLTDSLRLPLQKVSIQINSDECRMTNMGKHSPLYALGETK